MLVHVIEDDPGVTELLKEKLEELGYDIFCSKSGYDAINFLEKNTPYLIILDYSLPDMNGKELIEKLKKRNINLPPFIVCTGKGDELIAVEMMKLEARDYIIKDIHFLELLPEIIKRISKDIKNENKLKEMESAFFESETRLRAVFENSMDAIGVSKYGIHVFVNPSYLDMFGYSENELINTSILNLIAIDSREEIIEKIKKKSEQKGAVNYETRGLRKNGFEFDMEVASSGYILNDELFTLVILRDITQRKESEKQIKKLLKEKDLLIKEVHHRIKNNMNIIISLIQLQSTEIDNIQTTEALNITKNRIRSMMVLYDKLYMAENIKILDVKNYLLTLIDEIILNLPNSNNVIIKKEIDNFSMDIKILSPIGIILNELLTNSIKYAFKNTKKAELFISFINKNNHVILTLSDNGDGFYANFDIENSKGFGLKLVKGLAEQIEGNFKIINENGTKCILEFDL
ncbi:MAG: PAS domain S-box protein [Cyanobacteriota bacterium]